jgi:hypothetical protein
MRLLELHALKFDGEKTAWHFNEIKREESILFSMCDWTSPISVELQMNKSIYHQNK